VITFFSPVQLRHQGTVELIDGRMVLCFEKPERANIILDALRSSGHGDIREPIRHAKADYELAHSPAFIDFLEHAFELWAREVGPRDALPFAWPGRGARAFSDLTESEGGFPPMGKS
jgi:acetoin utilization deacetylase AcuC-like enzyme